MIQFWSSRAENGRYPNLAYGGPLKVKYSITHDNKCPSEITAYNIKIGQILGCCFRAKPMEIRPSKAAMGKPGQKNAAENLKSSKSDWLVAIKCKSVNAASGSMHKLAKMKDFQLPLLPGVEFVFSPCERILV